MLFWSAEEIQVLKENYGKIKLNDLVLLVLMGVSMQKETVCIYIRQLV